MSVKDDQDKVQQAIQAALDYADKNKNDGGNNSPAPADNVNSGIQAALDYAQKNKSTTPSQPTVTPKTNPSFIDSIKSTVKGAAYGALSGVSKLAGEAGEAGIQLQKYLSPITSPLIGAKTFTANIAIQQKNAESLLNIANQLDQYSQKKATGLEAIGYTAGAVVPDIFVPLMKNISTMIKAPVAGKDAVSTVGDILGGVGSMLEPGQALIAGAINVPFNALDIMSGKKTVTESFTEGVSFGAKFASISGITAFVMGPIVNPLIEKLVPTEIQSVRAAVQAIGNEGNPIIKKELQDNLSKFIITKIGKETIEGALGMGAYNSLLPAKTSEDRMTNFVNGIKQGALFSSVLSGLGIGVDALWGKPQTYTPLTQSKMEELSRTGTYTPIDLKTGEAKPPQGEGFTMRDKTFEDMSDEERARYDKLVAEGKIEAQKNDDNLQLNAPETSTAHTDTSEVRDALGIDPQKQGEAVKPGENTPVEAIDPKKLAAINDIQDAIQSKYGQKLDIFDENGVLKSQDEVIKEIKTLGLKDDSFAGVIYNDIVDMTNDIKGQYETNPSAVRDIPGSEDTSGGGITLKSELIPGASKIAQETAGNIHGIFEKINTIAGELHARLAPTEIGQAKEASGILSEMKAEAINSASIEKLQNKSLEEGFAKFNDKQLSVMIDNYEKTGLFAKGMEKYSAYYKETMNKALDIINNIFEDNPIQGVDNYIRHNFKFTNPEDETKFVEGFGKSFKGFSTSPFKKRIFDYMADAEAYMQANDIKYEVVSRNPETLRQWTLNNARKLDIYQTGINELKEKNLISFVKSGADAPPNMTPLEDRFAKVFFSTPQGIVQAGQYYAPSEVARIMNNAVSESWFKDSPIAEGLRGVNRTLNTLQLGLSVFHAITTTMNSFASDVALSMQELTGGQIVSGIQRLAKSSTIVYPVFEDFMKGKGLADDLAVGKQEAVEFVQNKLNAAGGRLGIETGYKMQAIDNFQKSWAEGNITGMATNAIPAVVQKLASPLMEYVIPRVKSGRFMKEAESAMERVTEGYTQEITLDAKRKLLGNIWNRIDDVHGQMVQDNLFWNNTQKDVANMMLRSFGWTYGTLRAIGSAVIDTSETIGAAKSDVFSAIQGKSGGAFSDLIGERGGVLTSGMAKLLAYPAAVAYAGATYQYMMTGKGPSEPLDYFFPKNGETGTDGKPVRVSIPGYMKDMFSYASNPLQTLKNKMSPEIAMMQQITDNKDFYNVMIRNPDDPAAKQAMDIGTYVLGQSMPFSIRNFVSGQAETASAQKTSTKDMINNIFGFSKAPKYIAQTDTEKSIDSEFKRIVGIKTYTPQEWNVVMAKVTAKNQAKAGDYTALKELLHQGVYTKKGYDLVKNTITRTEKKGGNTYQSLFSELPQDVQLSIWNKMSPEEQQQYQQFANKNMLKKNKQNQYDQDTTANQVPIY